MGQQRRRQTRRTCRPVYLLSALMQKATQAMLGRMTKAQAPAAFLQAQRLQGMYQKAVQRMIAERLDCKDEFAAHDAGMASSSRCHLSSATADPL